MKKIIICFLLISGTAIALPPLESFFTSEELDYVDNSQTIPTDIEELPFGFKIVVRDSDIPSESEEKNGEQKRLPHHFEHKKMLPNHKRRGICPPQSPSQCYPPKEIEWKSEYNYKKQMHHNRNEKEIREILQRQTELLEHIKISLEKLLQQQICNSRREEHLKFPFIRDLQ